MQRIARFEKVSFNEFQKAYDVSYNEKVYENIKLPHRATKGSAGYDFYAPFDFELKPGETIKIPTGIRSKMETNYVLMIFPRSSLGFKYRLQLNNTVGIIDSDYYNSDNEGHIFIKITNNTLDGKTIELKCGDAFAQGIFNKYYLAKENKVHTKRNGGFGSTNQK